jgi:hypothetical protein
MKQRIAVIAILVCIGIVCSISLPGNQTYAQSRKAAATPAMPQITVFNPMGTPPPVTLIPQAPRLNTLDGKTVYFLNTGYIGTDRLMAVMMDWFKANHPKTNVVYKDSSNGVGLSSLNEAMWAEVAEKADAVIAGLGH